ncbi:hypothetical protein BOW53_09265 [Solemya pervernicosa gill symbiont]|uniref:diguanylate cyclase n=2 Tax=Gammaproteobacteria incertae sedis TaxID=118884 RepID=A0A1T2L511_9GAMM|nr:GGDEF domain-containing protein [Candidatus Reidiella endopervernicosa]OOZ40016.1 hypothetical protein BOW53_09265 [Solemya pervernicosa gill symbiont]QKQ25299.1 diguanylate cyclase [Candidatus Reidiella endopervernicosa]
MAEDASGGNWQYKYYALLEQLEQNDKQAVHVENLLRRSLSRISLAADGLDESLDESLDDQLKALRKSIRDGVDHDTLTTIIDAISATLTRLDTQREKEAAAKPADLLIELFDVIEWPSGVARKLKTLRHDMERLNDETGLPPIIREFAGLLLEAGEKIAEEKHEAGEEGESEEKGGLFGRLFGRDKKSEEESVEEEVDDSLPEPPALDEVPTPNEAPPTPETEAAPSQPSTPQAEPVEAARGVLTRIISGVQLDDGDEVAQGLQQRAQQATEMELQRLTDELLALLNRSPAVVVASEAVTTEGEVVSETVAEEEPLESAPHAAEVLLQLMERLALPEELAERAELVKDQILSASDMAEWKAVLEAIADLISELRAKIQRERHDLEKFLEQITARLDELDEHLQGSSEVREASMKSAGEMRSQVQAQVAGISNSVEEASDIDVLKQDVQERIDTILRHVDRHHDDEVSRNEQLEEQVKTMQASLQDLEQESGELRTRMEQERSQAITDALTGINNRMAFDERIEQEFSRWKRFKEPLSLTVVDVDFFKKVNDTYGHKAGDKVLMTIAGLLGKNIRETDFLARYGGEKFVVIMPGADAEAAFEVADKLRMAIEKCGFHYQDKHVTITISCGISQFHSGDDPEKVFERADAALYKAKENGRNRCEIGK